MAVEGQLKQRLQEILQNSDLELVTENKIKMQLSNEFKQPMDAYKHLIKQGIEEYLDSLGDDDEEQTAPAAGNKRKATSDAQQPSKASKADAGGDLVWSLTGNKRASVSVFKGSVRVDLREYFKDDTGELKPGAKGLSLPFGQWLHLREHLPALAEAMDSKTEVQPVQLSSDRQAYVSSFNGKLGLHVREMYEKDGKLLPGKKGVCLHAADIAMLLEAADDLTAAAERQGGLDTQQGPAARATIKPAAAGTVPLQENVNPAAAAAARASGSAASGPASSSGFVDLGQDKRAAVTTFNKKVYVDLREYYMNKATGEKAPGKKGIMLTPQQFRIVAQHAAAISDAVAQGNMAYELDLGAKRKVSLSEFKSKLYVGIREFYEDAGVLKAGSKGLSMDAEQWQKLVAGLPQLQAQLG